MSQLDCDALAGVTGTGTGRPYGVRAYDVTALATTEYEIPELADNDAVTAVPAEAVWLSFVCNVEMYLLFGLVDAAGGLYLPTVAARWNSNPQQVPIRVPADVEYQRKFIRSEVTGFRVMHDGTGSDGVLRVERTSIVVGGTNVDTGLFPPGP